ncbi:MAG TPA: hypothetical protein VHO06_17120 [Polyangia bacterium]|nr:hypothetical protein [Polyangia bacterium]
MSSSFQEEKYVETLLRTRFGVSLRKIKEHDLKEPDYELLDAERRAAVVEIKHLKREPRTAANGWKPAPFGPWITRSDNGPSRVGQKIHEAYKQLCRYSEPRVLIILNDDVTDVHDLEEAFRGGTFYGSESFGYWNTSSAPIALGRIRAEKVSIDLYIWIDRLRREKVFFRLQSAAGHEIARRFFGCPADAQPEPAPAEGKGLTLYEALRALASDFGRQAGESETPIDGGEPK